MGGGIGSYGAMGGIGGLNPTASAGSGNN